MKLNIYQIDLERDTNAVAFESYDLLPKSQGTQDVDSDLYNRVYEGEVEAKDLEDVYRIFNIDKPEDFKGRSLSVSDVVEIVESDSAKPGFYYCDSIGFKDIEFDPSETHRPKETKITVIMCEPDKKAYVTEIGNELSDLQAAVDGCIEAFYPFESEECIVCNDEGKINGMELNRAIREEDTIVDLSYKEMATRFREAESHGEHLEGCVVFTQDSFNKEYSLESRTYKISSDNKAYQSTMRGYSIFASSLDGSDRGVRLDAYMTDEHGGKDGWKVERCYMYERGKEILDIIAGPCFICDCSGEDFGSLSDEQLRKYAEKFRYPEQFVRINRDIF